MVDLIDVKWYRKMFAGDRTRRWVTLTIPECKRVITTS